jgi:hypothetical protein
LAVGTVHVLVPAHGQYGASLACRVTLDCEEGERK